MAKPLSSKDAAGSNSARMIDGEALRRYISRAAAIMLEQKNLGEDLKEVCAECDEAGVASKSEIRTLARESLKDPEVLQARLDRLDALRHALGALAETPLGAAAVKKESRKPQQTEADIGEPVGAA